MTRVKAQNAAIIAAARIVFFPLPDGSLRCHKAASRSGVVVGGVYTEDFVRSYVKYVADVLVVDLAQIP